MIENKRTFRTRQIGRTPYRILDLAFERNEEPRLRLLRL